MRQDNLAFDDLLNQIDDAKFSYGFALTPVETFTTSLRRNTTPHVYGLDDVRARYRDKLRKETLVVFRIAKVMPSRHSLGHWSSCT